MTDDLDPLERHLLEALPALTPTSAAGAAPPEAEALWRAQVDSRLCDFAARWLQKEGRSFYTIGSAGHESNGAVALALRPTDPALLHYRSGAFYLVRAGPGGSRRRAGHHARRHRRGRRADRRRAPQGVRQPCARSDPADVHDRVAPAAGGRGGDRDRPGQEARHRLRLAGRRRRGGKLRRRLAQPRDRTGGAQHGCPRGAPAPAGAAPFRLRGQRAGDQCADAARLGRGRATRAGATPVRTGTGRRTRCHAGACPGTGRLGARDATARGAAPPHGALSEPCRRGRRVGVPQPAGDSRRLGPRPAPRHRPVAGRVRCARRDRPRGRLPALAGAGTGCCERRGTTAAARLGGRGDAAARATETGGRRGGVHRAGVAPRRAR